MLIYSLFTVLAAVALPSVLATPALLTRTVSLCLLSSAILAMNALSGLAIGDSLYNGLLSVTPVAIALSSVLLFGGAVALQPWAPQNSVGSVALPSTAIPTVATYPLYVLFTLIGGTVVMVIGDLITLYLAVELQSFALYIIASVISRDSETSTNSGLLYFLLGGLSSSIILLGSALLYSATGSTNLEAILSLLQVTDEITIQGFGPSALGFTLVGIGFIFKVTAAPFHHWGPDVYDGVPTIVATWLAVLPKISIFSLIVIIQTSLGDGILQVNIVNNTYDAWTGLLLICSLFSLIIGTVVGLAQKRIKRLLAYSTVSHVGFLLLALAVHSTDGIEAYLFYLVQYTVTALNAFLILLALGYIINWNTSRKSYDVSQVSTLTGIFKTHPALALAFAFCLFSIAGVPPFVGFFAKLGVLFSALNGGYMFMALVAVVVSIVSASYYLRVVRVMFFETKNITARVFWGSKFELFPVQQKITALHSYIISVLTLAVFTFTSAPDFVLDSIRYLALTLYSL